MSLLGNQKLHTSLVEEALECKHLLYRAGYIHRKGERYTIYYSRLSP